MEGTKSFRSKQACGRRPQTGRLKDTGMLEFWMKRIVEKGIGCIGMNGMVEFGSVPRRLPNPSIDGYSRRKGEEKPLCPPTFVETPAGRSGIFRQLTERKPLCPPGISPRGRMFLFQFVNFYVWPPLPSASPPPVHRFALAGGKGENVGLLFVNFTCLWSFCLVSCVLCLVSCVLVLGSWFLVLGS